MVMTHTIRQAMTTIVLGCLLFLNSAALPQVVMHSLHHDHHSSSTHNSPLCFWVCIAGQMEESSNNPPPHISHIIEILHFPCVSPSLAPLASRQHARGPPTSFPNQQA